MSDRSFKHNASFVMTRWPTIRRHKSLRPPSPSPSLQAKERTGRGGETDSGSFIPPRLHPSASQDSMGQDNSLHDIGDEEDGNNGRLHELTLKDKTAIRFIRKVKAGSKSLKNTETCNKAKFWDYSFKQSIGIILFRELKNLTWRYLRNSLVHDKC